MALKSKSQFEKYLDSKAKEKAKKPKIFISTKIECDWDFFLVRLWNKLFKKGE